MLDELVFDRRPDFEVNSPLDEYRSRPKQLARWLLESRDALRQKYREVKVELKRFKVRVHDLVESRDHWKQRAEFSDRQVQAMKTEVERLSALVQQADDLDKKK